MRFEVEKEESDDVLKVSLEQDDNDVNIRVNGSTVAYFYEKGELRVWLDKLEGYGIELKEE